MAQRVHQPASSMSLRRKAWSGLLGWAAGGAGAVFLCCWGAFLAAQMCCWHLASLLFGAWIKEAACTALWVAVCIAPWVGELMAEPSNCRVMISVFFLG